MGYLATGSSSRLMSLRFVFILYYCLFVTDNGTGRYNTRPEIKVARHGGKSSSHRKRIVVT